MRVRHGRRGFVALIAAYAVALQPLFAAVFALPAYGSEASIAVICSGTGPATDQPAGHDRICVIACAMANCAAVGRPPERTAVAPLQPVVATLVPMAERTVARPPERGPQVPRGPPSA